MAPPFTPITKVISIAIFSYLDKRTKYSHPLWLCGYSQGLHHKDSLSTIFR